MLLVAELLLAAIALARGWKLRWIILAFVAFALATDYVSQSASQSILTAQGMQVSPDEQRVVEAVSNIAGDACLLLVLVVMALSNLPQSPPRPVTHG